MHWVTGDDSPIQVKTSDFLGDYKESELATNHTSDVSSCFNTNLALHYYVTATLDWMDGKESSR